VSATENVFAGVAVLRSSSVGADEVACLTNAGEHAASNIKNIGRAETQFFMVAR
jgi:hypothetical protein